jgi:hypothetical protein
MKDENIVICPCSSTPEPLRQLGVRSALGEVGIFVDREEEKEMEIYATPGVN